MLVLGRKKKDDKKDVRDDKKVELQSSPLGGDVELFSKAEKLMKCVVTNKEEMLDAEVAKLVLPKNMSRDPVKSSVMGRDVYCVRIESPKKPVYNTWASRVMARSIYGNAVLISDADITTAEILAWYRRGAPDMTKNAGWGAVARRLRSDPTGFSESETVRIKREQERAEQERLKREHDAWSRVKRREESKIMQEYEELICNNYARYAAFRNETVEEDDEFIKYDSDTPPGLSPSETLTESLSDSLSETVEHSPDMTIRSGVFGIRRGRCHSVTGTTPFPTPVINPLRHSPTALGSSPQPFKLV